MWNLEPFGVRLSLQKRGKEWCCLKANSFLLCPCLEAVSLGDCPAEQGCAREGGKHPTLWSKAEASERSCPYLVVCPGGLFLVRLAVT